MRLLVLRWRSSVDLALFLFQFALSDGEVHKIVATSSGALLGAGPPGEPGVGDWFSIVALPCDSLTLMFSLSIFIVL